MSAKQLEWPLFFLLFVQPMNFYQKVNRMTDNFGAENTNKEEQKKTQTHISTADLKGMTFDVEKDTQWMYGAMALTLYFSSLPLTIIKIDICWSNWNPIGIESIPDVTASSARFKQRNGKHKWKKKFQ